MKPTWKLCLYTGVEFSLKTDAQLSLENSVLSWKKKKITNMHTRAWQRRQPKSIEPYSNYSRRLVLSTACMNQGTKWMCVSSIRQTLNFILLCFCVNSNCHVFCMILWWLISFASVTVTLWLFTLYRNIVVWIIFSCWNTDHIFIPAPWYGRSLVRSRAVTYQSLKMVLSAPRLALRFTG